MNKMEIAVKKLRKVVVDEGVSGYTGLVMTLQANMMKLGFMMSEELFSRVQSLSQNKLTNFADEFIRELKKLKGADVVYNPMYPNFPRQVMEASDLELWVNAMLHYWSRGTWIPEYQKEAREFALESVNYTEIGLATKEEFNSIFTKLVGSKESLSVEDRSIVEWFLKNSPTLEFPEDIPYKENMCLIGAYMVENKIPLGDLVKNATDVLRIATHMSGGDISLADNTRYKSFKRYERKALVNALEQVVREEDIARHAGKWTRLAHSLHVGDYSTKVFEAVRKVRENKKIETFNGKVEVLLSKGHVVKATKLLMQRPGDFARRLDHLIRSTKAVANQRKIINTFLSVADQVSTPVLLQLYGHFNTRADDMRHRVVFPKGSIQKAELISGLDPLNRSVMVKLLEGLDKTLVERFATGEPLGNVYIEEALLDCPIPTQQRSANTGSFSVARGTRMPIAEDKNTLRFFVYWKGRDIDLSAAALGDDFTHKSELTYYNLRTDGGHHSGDIVNAPRGASEFIDIDIDKMLARGIRYIAMDVRVYCGPTFAEHEKCYVGWMTRSHPNSNEIYDPATVEYKMDLTSESKAATPVIFDLQERKAIWTDLNTSANRGWSGNNVANNRANLRDVIEAIASNDNKASLYHLFGAHAEARGTLVDNAEDADIVFGWDGDVTPKDVTVINADYVV